MNAPHLGSFNTASSRTHVGLLFSTHDADGANIAPSDAFEAADIRIYKATDGAAFSATQRASAAGITMTSPFDSLAGLHAVDIDLADNTDSGFYAAGSRYAVVLAPDETIDGQALTGVVLAYFDIGRAQVDVREFGGSAGTFSGGRPEVNTTHAAGTAWGSGAITAAAIANDALTAAKIADNAIDAGAIAAGAITSGKFAAGAIDATAIAANAITSTKIADGAIAAAKIADGAITDAKFASGAITATVIAPNAFTAAAFDPDVTLEFQTGLATLDDVGAAVWDTLRINHQLDGSFGQFVKSDIAYIFGNPSAAENLKDSLSVSTARIASNVKAVEDEELTGDGSDGDPWRAV